MADIRILFLNNEFPPLGGGTGTVNLELFKELSKAQNLHIDLITSERDRVLTREEMFSDRIRILYVPVGNKNIHHSSASELIRYTHRAVKKIVSLYQEGVKYDIVFAFSTLPAGVVGALAKFLFSAPLIVSLQGPDIPGFEVRYRNLYPFLKPIIRWTWRSASCVTSISAQHSALARRTLSLPFKEIPNGIDFSLFHPNPSKNRRSKIRLLIVARLVKRKRVDLALRALHLINQKGFGHQWQLSIVGTGDEHEELLALASSLGLGEHVRFLGYVRREEMPEIYRENDIFLMTSEHEGMSMAMLEAMASGLAVITTHVGGVEELILSDNAGIVVDDDSPHDIARHLTYLIENPDRIDRLAESAVLRARKFSWGHIAQRYQEAFAQVLK